MGPEKFAFKDRWLINTLAAFKTGLTVGLTVEKSEECQYLLVKKKKQSLFSWPLTIDAKDLWVCQRAESNLTLKAPITTIVVCFVFCWLL